MRAASGNESGNICMLLSPEQNKNSALRCHIIAKRVTNHEQHSSNVD
jgi:hypothetical protein